MAFAILRTEKLKSFGNIGGSGSHVMRNRPTPNADPNMSDMNMQMVGSGNLVEDVKMRLSLLDKAPRKNAVLCVENLVTASPDFFENMSHEDIEQWAKDAVAERRAFWGEENVVSAVLHLDESTPHLHIHAVPVTPEGKLSCRDFLGGRAKLAKMQTVHAEYMQDHGYDVERGVAGSRASHVSMKKLSTMGSELKLREFDIEYVAGHEKNMFGVERAITKTATVVRAVDAQNIISQANKVPLLEHELGHARETAKNATVKVSDLQPKVELSLIRSTPLTDICQQFGYEQDQKDPSKYHTPVGTLSINDMKFYDHSAGHGGGGAIDFLMYAEGVKFKEAVEMLAGYDFSIAAREVGRKALTEVSAELKKPRRVIEPNHAPDLNPKLSAWMVNVRKIPAKVVRELIQSGQVYASRFHNGWQAIFKHNPEALQRVNPATGFKGFVSGSNYKKQPMILSGTGNQVAVVEGHMTGVALHAIRPDLNIAIAGSTSTIKNAVDWLEKNAGYEKILIAADNDPSGRAVIEKMPDYEPLLPNINGDWNNVLMKDDVSDDVDLDLDFD